MPRPQPKTAGLRLSAAAAMIALVGVSCGAPEEEPAEEPVEEPDSTDEADPGQDLDEDAPDAETEETQEEDTGDEEPEDEPALSQAGVSAGHPLAVEVGEQVLADGGNAVDAAIAVAFAVGAVEPPASGIGGGGSVILAGPDGEPVFYDFREVVNNDGEVPDSSTGIPGFVAGMGQLHEDYGTREWAELLEPTRDLAEEGFEVSDYLSDRIGGGMGPEYLAELEAFSPGGSPLEAGDQLVQPDLAETMQQLMDSGWEDYYTGELAESVASQVEGIDAQSLADYEVVQGEPVTGSFGEYEIASSAPSLPGVALIQMLQIAESRGIDQMEPGSAEYIDTLSEAWAVGEETMQTELGDPNFVDIDASRFTDPGMNAQADLSGTGPASGDPDSSAPNTTHLVVVDEDGLTVSMTNTVTDFWGSGQGVDGYFMNNALLRFDTFDSEQNQPESGRRSATWSNPTTVLDEEGRPIMPIGTPGGAQILPATAHVLILRYLHDYSPQEAVDALRFRGAEPSLYLEEGHDEELYEELAQEGWEPEQWDAASFGSVQLLEIDYETGELTGAEDSRRDGSFSILE
ncbi:gamma-glutamyltransferase family protein [Nesterenkonia sp. NBAIMH1]|uniref:gamma-glutamyltransferase family protein n=1 Tax=Nesterenkonia sp. NBAIMH1 TaxID=2600320 RepID=UPI0011B7AC1E|nr:gamma-glutamyltransferase [Nesterenkonia sp. NBAIMH1]